MNRKKPERYLPPSLITVLHLPVLLVVGPVAADLTWRAGSPWPFFLIPITLAAVYFWFIRRVRILH